MPLKVYQSTAFENTAEREIWDELRGRLDKEYEDKEDLGLLIGNLNCSGKELDAVFTKRDAIIVLEFKNYGGKISFQENGSWNNGEVEIKGGAGGKNPLQQVKDNRFALLNMLSKIFSHNANLWHISGIVLFHQSIEFDKNEVPPNLGSWFHVCDINNIAKKINQITSKEINLSKKNILEIPHHFNLDEKPTPTKLLINYAKQKKIYLENIIKSIENESDFLHESNIFKAGQYIPLQIIKQTKSIRSDYKNNNQKNLDKKKVRTSKFLESIVPESSLTEKGACHALLGEAGAGKSTLLRNLLYSQATKALDEKEEKIPVLIDLNAINKPADNIYELLVQYFYGNCSFDDRTLEEVSTYLKDCLNGGKLLLLFDGLDELARNLYDSITKVLASVPLIANNSIVISCRDNEYNNSRLSFNYEEVWVQSIDLRQINDFLDEEIDEDLLDIARNPLMLTLIQLIKSDTGSLPSSRGDAYAKAVKLLLKRKGHQDFDYLEKIEALERIAQEFTSEVPSIDESLIYKALNRIDWLLNDKDKQKKILFEILQSGIIKKIDKKFETNYSFLHKTFFEFFYAGNLAKGGLQKCKEFLLPTHIYDPGYENIICNIAYLSDDATEFIQMVLEQDDDIFSRLLFLSSKAAVEAQNANKELVHKIEDLIIKELKIKETDQYYIFEQRYIKSALKKFEKSKLSSNKISSYILSKNTSNTSPTNFYSELRLSSILLLSDSDISEQQNQTCSMSYIPERDDPDDPWAENKKVIDSLSEILSKQTIEAYCEGLLQNSMSTECKNCKDTKCSFNHNREQKYNMLECFHHKLLTRIKDTDTYRRVTQSLADLLIEKINKVDNLETGYAEVETGEEILGYLADEEVAQDLLMKIGMEDTKYNSIDEQLLKIVENEKASLCIRKYAIAYLATKENKRLPHILISLLPALESEIELLSEDNKKNSQKHRDLTHLFEIFINILAKLKDERVIDFIVRFIILQYKNNNKNSDIIETLGRIETPKAIEALIYLFNSDDKYVENIAVRTLGSIKTKEAFEPILRRIEIKKEWLEIKDLATDLLNKRSNKLNRSYKDQVFMLFEIFKKMNVERHGLNDQNFLNEYGCFCQREKPIFKQTIKKIRVLLDKGDLKNALKCIIEYSESSGLCGFGFQPLLQDGEETISALGEIADKRALNILFDLANVNTSDSGIELDIRISAIHSIGEIACLQSNMEELTFYLINMFKAEELKKDNNMDTPFDTNLLLAVISTALGKVCNPANFKQLGVEEALSYLTYSYLFLYEYKTIDEILKKHRVTITKKDWRLISY